MTVFRHKITKILYLIHYCIPRMILGRHFEATPYPKPTDYGWLWTCLSGGVSCQASEAEALVAALEGAP
jgi:hypothetical protein